MNFKLLWVDFTAERSLGLSLFAFSTSTICTVLLFKWYFISTSANFNQIITSGRTELNARHEQNHFNNSIAYFNRIIELRPENSEARYALAQLAIIDDLSATQSISPKLYAIEPAYSTNSIFFILTLIATARYQITNANHMQFETYLKIELQRFLMVRNFGKNNNELAIVQYIEGRINLLNYSVTKHPSRLKSGVENLRAAEKLDPSNSTYKLWLLRAFVLNLNISQAEIKYRELVEHLNTSSESPEHKKIKSLLLQCEGSLSLC